MKSRDTFQDEIASQLESDILSFGWLRQMAETQFTQPSEITTRQAVIDVVSSLVESGVAVVGDARNERDMVLIDAWPERGEALKERMQSKVKEAAAEDQDWAFWVQLRKHFNKE